MKSSWSYDGQLTFPPPSMYLAFQDVSQKNQHYQPSFLDRPHFPIRSTSLNSIISQLTGARDGNVNPNEYNLANGEMREKGPDAKRDPHGDAIKSRVSVRSRLFPSTHEGCSAATPANLSSTITNEISSAPVNASATNGQIPFAGIGANTNNNSSPTILVADDLHIQRMYQRISEIGGIPRDVSVDGVGFTRERKTEASFNGYLRSQAQPQAGVNRRNSEKPFSNLLVTDDTHTQLPKSAPPSGFVHQFGHQSEVTLIASRNGSLTESRAVTPDNVIPSSAKLEQEGQDELTFLEKVDHYGFFASIYGKHARLVLLRSKECLEVPERSFKNPERKNGRSPMTASTSSDRIASPYLSVDSNGASAKPSDTSRRSSSQARISASFASSSFSKSLSGQADLSSFMTSLSTLRKEASRSDKWYSEMLIPSSRDEGGNISTWRLASESEEKLRRRVIKGIPDRWRAAAWEALMTRAENRGIGKSKERVNHEASSRKYYVSLVGKLQAGAT